MATEKNRLEPRDAAGATPTSACLPPPGLLLHLQSPALFRRLSKLVRNSGLPSSLVEDVVQGSLLEAWQARSTWGPTVDDIDRLLTTITKRNVIDHKKRWARSRRVVHDVAEPARDGDQAAPDPDESLRAMPIAPPDPLEARSRLRAVDAFVAKNPSMARAAQWLLLNLSGESYRAIAAKAGTSENAVSAAVGKLRLALRSAAKEGVIVLVVTALAALALVATRHRKSDDTTAPLPAPVVTAPAPDGDALRRLAFEACEAQSWASCAAYLDEAKVLDPRGESDPRVQQARREIAEGRGP
jgi:DNA-directed RNA polymerase specialized sigma24 family protein